MKNEISYEEEVHKALDFPTRKIYCSLPKSKLLTALKDKNKGGDVKVAELQKWVDDHYDKKEGSPHFVRAK